MYHKLGDQSEPSAAFFCSFYHSTFLSLTCTFKAATLRLKFYLAAFLAALFFLPFKLFLVALHSFLRAFLTLRSLEKKAFLVYFLAFFMAFLALFFATRAALLAAPSFLDFLPALLAFLRALLFFLAAFLSALDFFYFLPFFFLGVSSSSDSSASL